MCEGKFFPFVLSFLSLYRTINITYPVLKKSHGSKRGILCVLVKPLYFTRMSIHPYSLYALLFPAHFIQFDAARLVKMRFIHLHTVKNCGSSCGASIQEPDNCRPLDAQQYPLPSSTAHRRSEQNEELDFKNEIFSPRSTREIFSGTKEQFLLKISHGTRVLLSFSS